MTSNQHWFDIAVKLKENKIAEPVLWMGDWHHYKKAKELFGDKVVKDFDFFKFKSHKIKDINYKSNFNDFFLGLTTSLINPKILIFFSSVFSQFIESDYNIETKLTMALLAGIIDAFWYMLVSYSINTKKIQNYLKLRQSKIFLILGIILLFFSSYLILKSVEYFL